MRVFIAAGGKGTRIAPYTDIVPKPLLPVAGVPCIYRIILGIFHYNVCTAKEITVVVNATDENIFTHALHPTGVVIKAVDTPRGNMWDVVEEIGDEPFVLRMGDELTRLDYTALIKTFTDQQADALVVATDKIRSGMGRLDLFEGSSKIRDFVEKPVIEDWFFATAVVFSAAAKGYIEPGDNAGDVIKRMIKAHKNVQVYKNTADWVDVGTIEGYRHANDLFA